VPVTRLTRRETLAATVGIAAALGAESQAARALASAAAAVAPAGRGLGAIEHVVILIQENRSFDHYFGSYPGVRGFSDPNVPRQADGLSVFAQPGYAPGRNPDGHLLPFHLDTQTSNAECTHDINHDWLYQHDSLAGGAMDGFVRSHLRSDPPGVGPLTMGYYTRADLPFYYALADAFTICDGYHASLIGPTNPNRFFTISATIDPEGRAGGPVLDDSTSGPTLHWHTMPEALQKAGVSWKVYQSPEQVASFAVDSNSTANNVLAYFANYQDRSSQLHQRAFTPTFPGDLHSDVLAGTLPSVSWVLFEAAVENDEHPPAPPEYGEDGVAKLLKALTANPEVWAKTVLFITYDENGGFFDHVSPPTPPPGSPGEYLTGEPLPESAKGLAGPIGLGFRVPLLVVSPFARGGWICSETFDHTSLLRFLETRFDVPVPNLSAWRRSVTGDLTASLDLDTAPDTTVPTLPATSMSDPTVARECSPGAFGTGAPGLPGPGPYPVPPNGQPVQEPGQRRHRALAPGAPSLTGPPDGAVRPPNASVLAAGAPSPSSGVPSEAGAAHRRAQHISARFFGRRHRLHGLLLELSTSRGFLIDITAELRRGHYLLARARATRVGTRRQQLVLRRVHRTRLRPGHYTLVIRQRGTPILRRTVRVG